MFDNQSFKVSVIIPNYNHAEYLPKRIESVLNQSYKNLEIIILDDCSPDNSREIISKYAAGDARIKTVYNEHNSGSTFKQWNKGFSLAKGKYIWIAESDDYADNSFLATLLPFLEGNDKVGLAYSASYTVDEHNAILDEGEAYFAELDSHLWKEDFVLDGLPLIRNAMVKGNVIPNASAVVLRKSVIQQIGPADGTKRLVGDWLYWAQILACNKIAYCAKPLNYFRKHTNNVRSSNAVSGVALLEFVEVLQQLKSYSDIDPAAYEARLSFIFHSWFNSIVYSKVSIGTHFSMYKALSKLDNSTDRRLRNLLFSNRLSGLRMLIGDGWLLPMFNKK